MVIQVKVKQVILKVVYEPTVFDSICTVLKIPVIPSEWLSNGYLKYQFGGPPLGNLPLLWSKFTGFFLFLLFIIFYERIVVLKEFWFRSILTAVHACLGKRWQILFVYYSAIHSVFWTCQVIHGFIKPQILMKLLYCFTCIKVCQFTCPVYICLTYK